VEGSTLQREPYPGAMPGARAEHKAGLGPAEEADVREVRQAVDHLNEAVKTLEVSARFRVLDDPHQVVVEMYDTNTGDVIREIPPRRLLQMYADMMHLVGISLDRRA